jgi:hypothetical protein
MVKTNRRSMCKGGGFWQALGYPDNTNSDTGTTGTVGEESGDWL